MKKFLVPTDFSDTAKNAARYAVGCGRNDLIDCLLMMAEVEWEHERYFRELVTNHWLTRIFTLWDGPPPKAHIRDAFKWQSIGLVTELGSTLLGLLCVTNADFLFF